MVTNLEKVVDLDLLPDFVLSYVNEAKFFEDLESAFAGFSHMTLRRFVQPLGLFRAEANLERVVSVCSRLFLLHDDARAGLNHGYGNDVSIRVIELRHSNLSANEPCHMIPNRITYRLALFLSFIGA